MSLGAGGDRVVRMMLFHMLQWTVKCSLYAASSAEPVFPENDADTLGALLSIAKHGRSSIKERRVIWAYSFWWVDHPGREGMAAEGTPSLQWELEPQLVPISAKQVAGSSDQVVFKVCPPGRHFCKPGHSLNDFTASPDNPTRWGASAQTLESTEWVHFPFEP